MSKGLSIAYPFLFFAWIFRLFSCWCSFFSIGFLAVRLDFYALAFSIRFKLLYGLMSRWADHIWKDSRFLKQNNLFCWSWSAKIYLLIGWLYIRFALVASRLFFARRRSFYKYRIFLFSFIWNLLFKRHRHHFVLWHSLQKGRMRYFPPILSWVKAFKSVFHDAPASQRRTDLEAQSLSGTRLLKFDKIILPALVSL